MTASRLFPAAAVLALPATRAAAATVMPAEMMTPTPQNIAIAALLAATLFGVALWAGIRGRAASQRAKAAEAWGLRLRALLATTPGAYLIVSQTAVLGSESLRSWLSLDQRIAAFSELAPQADRASGLMEADYAALRQDITATRASGAPFTRLVHPLRGDRVLLAEGRMGAADVASDSSVVVWFSDVSDAQGYLASLQEERDRLARDLETATALLEAAPFPIWHRDAELKLRQVNMAYVRAVEAGSAREVVERGVELINSALSTAPQKSAQRARDQNAALSHVENVIIGGGRRSLDVHEVPLGDGGVGGFALDITEGEEARVALARYALAQNETLDQLSAGVAIFAQDRGLTFHNKAFVRLFDLHNLRLDDLLDFSEVLELMRDRRRLPEQSNFPAWKRERIGWFTNVLEPVEETWALPDETVLRVVAQPHPFGGLVFVFEDQSEQLSLASARDTLLKAYQATLNQLHEAVAVFAHDGRVQLYNSGFASAFGLTPADLADEPHVEALSEAIATALSGDDESVPLHEVVRAATLGRQRREGRMLLENGRMLEFRAVPLPNGNALVTFLDVTDSRRIERALRERSEALEEADRLKSKFVSNMSYELRTPLTTIIGFAQMLEQGYHGALNEKQAEYARAILTSSERLQLLISDILDLAVTEAGTLVLEVSRVDIADLIASVAMMVEEQALANAITLTHHADPGAGAIEGDERRLKQVIYNLLVNGIRFTPPGGSVRVVAHGDERSVAIEVIDTGIGISEAEQKMVFNRFHRGANAPATTGMGLGLSLVQQFVSLHGGTVSLSSSPGTGTSVSISLPRVAPREPLAGLGLRMQ